MTEPNPTDSFQLYDLKVQVICPPGERILCGAKEGDYFTLQGEMLHLPPGQGISIYSLCEMLPSISIGMRRRHDLLLYSIRAALVGGKAASHG